MTGNGAASGGVQAGHLAQQERVALQENDDVRERSHEDLLPVIEPVPPQAYNGRGKLVPAPALSVVDLTI